MWKFNVSWISYLIIWACARQNQQNDMCPTAKTQISLSIRPVWSESLLFAWRNLVSLATHGAHREHSDQTVWMSRLILVSTGCTGHFVGFVVRRPYWIFNSPSIRKQDATQNSHFKKRNSVFVAEQKLKINISIEAWKLQWYALTVNKNKTCSRFNFYLDRVKRIWYL